MVVFFTASYYGKAQYQSSYDLVLSALENSGVTIISPEKGNYQEVLTHTQLKKLATDKNRLHYEAVKKGIFQADAVIIDMSHQDFQIGWEAALACQNKKPLLCLSVNEDFSGKITHPFFHAARYTELTIDNLIEDFIKKTQKGLMSARLNFFLTQTQLEKAKRDAARSGLTLSQHLRNLIDQK